MNSAPALVTISHILIFSSSVRRHVSMITFKILPLHASWICLISSSTSSYLPSFKNPMLITISISSAPFAIASFVSKTFVAVVTPKKAPAINGLSSGALQNTTSFAQPRESCSLVYSAACFTYAAGMHADAHSYLIPSSRISLMSVHVAVCESNVWSTIFKTSLVFIISCLSFFIHCDRFTNFQFV